jgi:hypothetical protein
MNPNELSIVINGALRAAARAPGEAPACDGADQLARAWENLANAADGVRALLARGEPHPSIVALSSRDEGVSCYSHRYFG